jgi:hypothetical protein
VVGARTPLPKFVQVWAFRWTLSFLVSTLLVSTFFPSMCVLCFYAHALLGFEILLPFFICLHVWGPNNNFLNNIFHNNNCSNNCSFSFNVSLTTTTTTLSMFKV